MRQETQETAIDVIKQERARMEAGNSNVIEGELISVNDLPDEKKRRGRKLEVASGAVGAGIGFKTGSKLGQFVGDDYGNAIVGTAFAGAGIGFAAGAGGTMALKGVAKAGFAKAKSAASGITAEGVKTGAKNAASFVGRTAVNTGKTVGLGVARGVTSVIQGVGAEGAMATFASPLRRHAYAAKNIVEGAFVAPEGFQGLHSFSDLKDLRGAKLTGVKTGFQQAYAKTEGGIAKKGMAGVRGSLKSGKVMAYKGALAVGMKDAYDTMNQIKQGQQLGGIYSPTPGIPSYDDNSGATGDLVFALHKMRN